MCGGRVDLASGCAGRGCRGSRRHRRRWRSVGAIDAAPHRRRRGQILAAYRRLGVPEVRRHRLHLESGKVSDAQPDLVAAFSELVGHDCYPGLWCLAPWQRDGHPDHDAVGLVAEAVCRTYNLRLVRYLCAAWEWLQPEDLPWRRRPPVHAVGQRASTQGRRCGAPARYPGSGVGSRPRVVSGLRLQTPLCRRSHP